MLWQSSDLSLYQTTTSSSSTLSSSNRPSSTTVPIPSKTETAPPEVAGSGLSTGDKAAIALGAVFGTALLLGAFFFFWVWYRRRKLREASNPAGHDDKEPRGMSDGQQVVLGPIFHAPIGGLDPQYGQPQELPTGPVERQTQELDASMGYHGGYYPTSPATASSSASPGATAMGLAASSDEWNQILEEERRLQERKREIELRHLQEDEERLRERRSMLERQSPI